MKSSSGAPGDDARISHDHEAAGKGLAREKRAQVGSDAGGLTGSEGDEGKGGAHRGFSRRAL